MEFDDSKLQQFLLDSIKYLNKFYEVQFTDHNSTFLKSMILEEKYLINIVKYHELYLKISRQKGVSKEYILDRNNVISNLKFRLSLIQYRINGLNQECLMKLKQNISEELFNNNEQD